MLRTRLRITSAQTCRLCTSEAHVRDIEWRRSKKMIALEKRWKTIAIRQLDSRIVDDILFELDRFEPMTIATWRR